MNIVGLDIAKRRAQVCVTKEDGTIIEERSVVQRPEELSTFFARYPGDDDAVMCPERVRNDVGKVDVATYECSHLLLCMREDLWIIGQADITRVYDIHTERRKRGAN